MAFWSEKSPPARMMVDELIQQTGDIRNNDVRFFAVIPGRQNLTGQLPAGLKGIETVSDTDYSLAQRFKVAVLPTVLILDNSLRVVMRVEGFSRLGFEGLRQRLIQLAQVSGQ
ncbi:MAG: hypothetical protein ABIK44_05485 [candidate division WOR-3 bacterium]